MAGIEHKPKLLSVSAQVDSLLLYPFLYSSNQHTEIHGDPAGGSMCSGSSRKIKACLLEVYILVREKTM